MGSLLNVLPVLKEQVFQENTNKKYCFIETGTYLGDSVAIALKEPQIGPIYSIELQERFYNASQFRFLLEPQVKILFGNSEQWLRSILCNRNKIYADPPRQTNFIFWLDAHIDWGNFSQETPEREWCPLLSELTLIKEYYKHGDIIAIDDMRIIRNKDGWGNEVTYDQIIDTINSINPHIRTILIDSSDAKEDILLAF